MILPFATRIRRGMCQGLGHALGQGFRCAAVSAIASETPAPAAAAAAFVAARSQATAAAVRQPDVRPAVIPVPKKRSAETKRDPEAPKRPLSAYFRFLADFRAKNTDVKGREVITQAAATWKGLTTLQKAPFTTPYMKELETFKKAQENYVASGKKEAWKRDPERPKVPMTGFLRFAQDYRKTAAKGLKVTEVMKKASTEWKTFPEEKRKVYDEAYRTEKAKHDEAMKVYKASGKEEAWKKRVGYNEAQEAKKAAKKKAAAKASPAPEAKKEKAAAKAAPKAKATTKAAAATAAA